MQVAPGLAGLGRVLAPDLPGFGRSPRAGRSTTLMDERRWLSRFLERPREGPVVLAGNSMGGLVALLRGGGRPRRGRAASSSPRRSSRLPRGGLPAPARAGLLRRLRRSRLGEALVRARRAAVDPDTFVRLGLRMLTVDPSAIPEDVIALHADLIRDLRQPTRGARSRSSRRRVRSTPTCGAATSARRAMSNVRCPVLVIHGRKDRFVPVGNALVALRTYPAWRGRLLAACRARAADGGAGSLADGGRRLVRGGAALSPC